MKKTYGFAIPGALLMFSVLCMCGALAKPALGQDVPYPTDDEIKVRYGSATWPGANGPVWSGVPATALQLDDWAATKAPYARVVKVAEHNPSKQTEQLGYGVRFDTILAPKGKDHREHHLRVEIDVTTERLHARTLLLNQFLSHHSLPPYAAPHLPWGEVHESGLGDVAFVHRKRDDVHRIVFVRGNVFVRIDALGDGTGQALAFAKSLDQRLQKGAKAVQFSDFEGPAPTAFEFEDSSTPVGVPTVIDLRVPRALTVDWIAPHGDLVQDLRLKGDLGYRPRQLGPLTLVLIDPKNGTFGLHTRAISE